MPLILASLLGGLIQIAATLAGRVVLALGFSVVVYSGLSTTLDFLEQAAIDAFGGFTGRALSVVSTLQIDTAVTVIFSAVAARMLLRGLTNGSLARWVTRP